MMQRGDPPFRDIPSAHVSANDRGLFHADNFTPEVFNKLLQKLGLEWCAECNDFHEIAGGSSATRSDSYAASRGVDELSPGPGPGP